MSLQLPNIPALSTKVDTEVRRAFDALKGWLVIASSSGGIVTQESLVGDMASNPELTALFDGTIPPQIQNFTVVGAFAKIMLEWDDPRYLYLSFVEVYRNTTDDLGTAQKIGTTNATLYADAPPNSSAAVDYYYWVRCVSKSGVRGPYNATAGTAGRTALDPTYALQVLSGQLTTSELHNDLNGRINLIDQDNTGLVSLLNNLAVSTGDLIVAEAERWERLLFEKMVTDATVEVAPVAYCTLSAFTSEATCVAGGGIWRPAGTIRLKATADITTDVEAAVRTVTSELNAMAGTLTDTVSAVTAHGQNIVDYLTGTNSVISQLNGAIQQRVSTEYVDLKTDAIANAADVATYASEMNIPESLAYLILHNDDARRKLRGNTAHIATAQQDILTNADAIEAEAIARLALTATVDDHYASLLDEQTARADADSAEATARLLLNSKVEDNQAALESNYYTKTDTEMAIAGWSDRAIATSNNNTASVITNYYTKAQVDLASAGWYDSAVSAANGHTATLLEDYSSTVDMNTAIATAKTVLSASLNSTFRQATMPTERGTDQPLQDGDLWIDIDDGNKSYIYNGSEWVYSADATMAANTAAIEVEQQVRASAIAPTYSDTLTYPAGFTVCHSAALFRCTTPITIPEAWNAARWTPVTANLYAQYTVKLDVNGKVSGFGMANDGASSTFEILADKFAIAASGTDPNAADKSPFFHLSSPQMVDGVELPAGTYIKAAYIVNLTANNIKSKSIGADEITVTDLAALSADLGAVTAGSINIGSGKFQVDEAGNVIIESGTAGARMVIQNNVIKVYDSNNVLRVKLGDLSG